MSSDTVPWVVATLLHDTRANRIALHEHLMGGSVERIAELHGYLRDSGDCTMVDLWARVPADLVDDYKQSPIEHARAKRGEHDHKYNRDNPVGW